jgi:deoxyribonuclease-4
MLIGAHVSTAGGLVKAHERGVERGCAAIQIFNQSPRQWRPTSWPAEDVAAFRERMAGGPIESVVIHAVYLINCAAADRELRARSLRSLTHALRTADAIAADGVVLHPGSARGEGREQALRRIADALRHALGESERSPILLENTAGGGDTLGRSFEELARLVELAGGDGRLGLCVDSAHILASGYDIRDAGRLERVIDELVQIAGRERLRCIHVNDSLAALGSNRDRHAPLGEGQLGVAGCAAFLSEPRFEGLPAIFEGPGAEGKTPARADVEMMRELRSRGLRSRRERERRSGAPSAR